MELFELFMTPMGLLISALIAVAAVAMLFTEKPDDYQD